VNYKGILSLVDTSKFWRYHGGLTTPPCTEDKVWTVLQEPWPISKANLDMVKKQYDAYAAVDPKLNGNARKIQPLNDRVLMKVSNEAIVLMTAGAAVVSSYLLF